MSTEVWISVIGVVIAIGSAFVTSFLLIGKYKEKVDALEKRYEKIETELHKMSVIFVSARRKLTSAPSRLRPDTRNEEAQ